LVPHFEAISHRSYSIMAASLKVSRQAYGKIFLHAAKNFDSLILGYIIGTESNGQFSITDVLPVSHSNPAGPILEISGDVVRHFSVCFTFLLQINVIPCFL